jgi:arylesterase / paraoxonase
MAAVSLKRRIAILGAILGVTALSYWLTLFAQVAALFQDAPPNTSQACRRIPGPIGPEDLALDAQTGLIYATSADRRGVEDGRPPNGAIYVIDANAEAPTARRLETLPAQNFFPHGLGLWRDATTARLFAVNHGQNGQRHSIELFDIQADGALRHAETITGSLLRSPNDVAPFGPEAFFAANDPFSPPSVWRRLQTYLLIPNGDLVGQVDGRMAQVAQGFKFANGVAIGPDLATVLVADSTSRSVSAFERAPARMQLASRGVLSLPMAVDNLTWEASGSVLVAGHPKPLAFQAHARDPERVNSPSAVYVFRGGGFSGASLLFADHGARVSGASVAVRDARGRLYIGSVYERFVLLCDPE